MTENIPSMNIFEKVSLTRLEKELIRKTNKQSNSTKKNGN